MPARVSKLLFALIVLVVSLPSSAQQTLSIDVGDATGSCKQNVDVPVTANSIEGGIRLEFQLSYDVGKLLVVDQRPGGATANWTVSHVGGGVFRVSAPPSVVGRGGGTVAILTFRILESTSGSLPVTVVGSPELLLGNLQGTIKGSGSAGTVTANCCTAAPAAPVVTIGTVSDSSVALSWPAVQGATSYRVYEGSSSTPLYDGPVTSWVHTALGSSTQHCYQVTATNVCGESLKSQQRCATTLACTAAPVAPVLSSVSPNSDTALTISWNGVAGATSYRLYRNGSEVWSGNSTTHTNSGLSAATQYCYTVRAENTCGDSAVSTQRCGTTNSAPSGLSLDGGKFTVILTARDPRTGNTGSGLPIPQTSLFGYFAIPDLTGDAGNPEVFVKILDGHGVNGKYWFFYGGLTDFEYTLKVTKASDGSTQTYTKPGYQLCGGADTNAFSKAAYDGISNTFEVALPQPDPGRFEPDVAGACSTATELCLLGGKYALSMHAWDPRTGANGGGNPIPQTDLFGYFSIPDLTGNPGNPEMFVKMLDGRGVNGKYWVFYGGLTDFQVMLHVRDTTTGAQHTYLKGGETFCGGADTDTFASSTSANPANITWKRIPAGTYTMGCTAGDIECQNDELAHTVTLTKPFDMAETETTNAQDKLCRDSGKCTPTWWTGGDNHPVANRSWFDAVEFCAWAGGRLPTEAEWEYAARGGRNDWKYPWGNTLSNDDANYISTGGRDIWDRSASPVKSFSANGYGLYDMAGNVYEWVADWFAEYSDSSESNPQGPTRPLEWRVFRGGSFFIGGAYLRVSARVAHFPNDHQLQLGFRCVRDVIPGSANCTYSLSANSASIAASGGSDSFTVTASQGCTWVASPNVDWITVTAGASGNGTGTVTFVASANATASGRTGAINAGGKTFTVTQSGVTSSGITWKRIPGGTFMMGCTAGDPDCLSGETPAHEVTLTRSYDVAESETTNGQYKACVKDGSCTAPFSYLNDDTHPVVWVDWKQAVAYCEWAGGRLPTEAEWERAARGDKAGQRYPWGNTESDTAANCNGSPRWPNTAPVMSYGANGYGLYDVSGNVWEWVFDALTYYDYSPATDPKVVGGDGWARVIRGGAWQDIGYGCRVSSRVGSTGFSDHTGFRCARDVTE